jgi:hypothetical protein
MRWLGESGRSYRSPVGGRRLDFMRGNRATTELLLTSASPLQIDVRLAPPDNSIALDAADVKRKQTAFGQKIELRPKPYIARCLYK